MNRIFLPAACLVLAATSAACTRATSQEPSGVPSGAPLPSAAAAASMPPAATPPAAKPRDPLPWGTRPDPQAPLAYVADGYCVGLDVALLPEATLVYYGGATVARATDQGLAAWEETSRGLQGQTISDITGSFPDNAWLQMNDGGRAFDFLWYYRWSKDQWVPGLGKSADPQHQYDGLVAFGKGALAISVGDPEKPAGVSLASSGFPAPPQMGGFQPSKIVAFGPDSGMIVGRACAVTADDKPCPFQARRFGPGAPTQIDALGSASNWAKVHAAARSPGDAAVSIEARVLRFDGTKWTPLALPKGPSEWDLHYAPDGSLWVEGTSKVLHIAPDGAMHDVTPPRPLAMNYKLAPVLDGVEAGAPYAALDDGSLVRFEARPATAEGPAAWRPVEVPRSPFAWGESKKGKLRVEGVRVRSAEDVWVNVKYVEWPAHYANQMYQERRALLRTVVPDETLLCAREGGKGFVSWPPIADASCERKLIIPLGAPAKGNHDLTESRKIVAAKKELAGATFVSFNAGGGKVAGIRAPDYETGKSLLTALKGVRYTMHELVCADPEDLQPLDPAAL